MALMETLVDDFTSGTIDTAKWTNVTSGVSIVSGRLQLVDSTGAYPFASSAGTYDIRNSYALAQVTPAPRSGGNSQQTYFMFYASSGNGFGLAVGDTSLYKVTMVGGVETDTSIATYNATTHAWWRIRHNGTNIVLGWSSDGTTWTEGTPFAPGVTLGTTGWLNLNVGRWQAGDTATGYFDNVNSPPAASTPKSDSDIGSGSDNAGTVVQKYVGSDTGTSTDNAGTVVQKYTGTDTGTSTDNAGTVVQQYAGTDTGTSTDNAGTLVGQHAGTDTGTGSDNAGTVVQKYTGTDTGTSTDSAGTVVITQSLTSADTVSSAESAGSVAQTYTKSDADTSAGTDATSGRKSSDVDAGTSTDTVTGKTSGSADTVSGTDSSGNLMVPKSDTDTAAAVDAEPSRKVATGDTGSATEGVSGKQHGDTDARTVAEAADVLNLASIPKSDSETVTRVESATTHQPGGFTQIPSPKVWSNGDNIDHGTLNKEWRDTFNWLLRRNSPGISVYNSDGASLTYANNVAIPLKTEEFKRGNITHATNDTKVYVWETGWYLGYVQIGGNYASVSGDGLKPASVVKVNGTVASRSQTTRDTNSVAIMEHQFSLYLQAGDYVEIAMGNDWSGTLTGYPGTYGYPFLSMWWRSN